MLVVVSLLAQGHGAVLQQHVQPWQRLSAHLIGIGNASHGLVDVIPAAGQDRPASMPPLEA